MLGGGCCLRAGNAPAPHTTLPTPYAHPLLRAVATHNFARHRGAQQAKDDKYLAENLMMGLPSLGERVQDIRQGKAATSAQENDKNFARSQVSVRGWWGMGAEGRITLCW